MTAQFTLPAADAPAEEWGRLAVSIPGFTWLDGMADIYGVRVHESRGDYVLTDMIDADGCRDRSRIVDMDPPDPDDSATAGALLSLLGDDVWRISKGFTHNDWRAVVRDACEPWQDPETGDLLLGRACIAAAAALGRWPGGAA